MSARLIRKLKGASIRNYKRQQKKKELKTKTRKFKHEKKYKQTRLM